MRQLRLRAHWRVPGGNSVSCTPWGRRDRRGSRTERRPSELLWPAVAPPAPAARRTGGVPGAPELSQRHRPRPVRRCPCPAPSRAPLGPLRFSHPARRCYGNLDVIEARFAAGREGSARHSVALCGSTGVRGHGGGGPGSGRGGERKRERGGGERGRKECDGLSGRPPPHFAGLQALFWAGMGAAEDRVAWPGISGRGYRARCPARRCRGGTWERALGPSPRSARLGL